MKKLIYLISLYFSALSVFAVEPSFPSTIFSGEQDCFHVQGIAVDIERGYVYYSFTTSLVKTDLDGNLIGTVEGITGHLGCISINPDDGRVYGSLEYKPDAIGQGILKNLGKEEMSTEPAFYIAIFEPDKIVRKQMSAESDGVMTTVYVVEAVKDFKAIVENEGRTVEHRLGCSGIDGLTFAPAIGKNKEGKNLLYVAYGVYGDTSRTDNDYQVILCYDPAKFPKYEQVLSQENMHKSGPEKPLKEYFVYTGNTEWGIQNLCYDSYSDKFFAAVYKGKKTEFKNYSLFAFDRNQKPEKETLRGIYPKEKGLVLKTFPDAGGWYFPYGSTGVTSIGDGYFYISHNHRDSVTKKESTTLYRYRLQDDFETPFVK